MAEGGKGRILVVDDDALFRAALAARLEAGGFQVREAPDGAEAVRRVRGDRSLDVVVLDLNLPGLDGRGTLDEIKRFRPELPVVVLTGFGSVESAMEMGSRGVFRYLEKPADPDQICAVLADARREKLRAMARHDMAMPTRPSRWARLVGSHNSRPGVILLGAVLLAAAALAPVPRALVALLDTPKTVAVHRIDPSDPTAAYLEYKDMSLGETIAARYARHYRPAGTRVERDEPPELTPEKAARHAMIMIALLLAAAVFWATGAVPIGITALIVAVIMCVDGVMRPDQVAQAFAKDSVIFIFGVLAFSRVMTRTGLDRRLGMLLLSPVRSLPVLVFGFLPVFAIACSFISASVLVAVMMPLLLTVYGASLQERNLERDRPLLVLLALGLCYASNLGGPGSPAAGARNAVMIGILADYGQAPSFATWMKYGMPYVPVATLALGLYLAVAFRRQLFGRHLDVGASVRNAAATLGRVNREEKLTALVFVGVVALWVFGGTRMGLGGTVLLGLVVLNLLRVMKWSDITHIHWEVVFLYAGASAIGKALATTGGALYLAKGLVGLMPDAWLHGAGLPMAAGVLTGVTTNFMSDGATVAVLGPMTVPMASAAGQHSLAVGLATAFASSFAHLLIIGTPSCALVYAMCKDPVTGVQIVRQKDFLRHGSVVFVISFAVLWLWTFNGYWRWIGFPSG